MSRLSRSGVILCKDLNFQIPGRKRFSYWIGSNLIFSISTKPCTPGLIPAAGCAGLIPAAGWAGRHRLSLSSCGSGGEPGRREQHVTQPDSEPESGTKPVTSATRTSAGPVTRGSEAK